MQRLDKEKSQKANRQMKEISECVSVCCQKMMQHEAAAGVVMGRKRAGGSFHFTVLLLTLLQMNPL
jgi:hypothetical protein